jgi:hypothetical protein
MKWLLLLALISCGNHEEPRALDLHDHDGDQVLNYEETDFDKYVANIEALGNVSGVLTFNLNIPIEIKFSNKVNLEEKTLDLITINEDRLKSDDYFSEWTQLLLETSQEPIELKRTHYKVRIEFSSGSDKAGEIVLKKDKEIVSLGAWSQEMDLRIEANDLKAIISGKHSIFLRKFFPKTPLFQTRPDDTIREKTYRVYLHDGNQSSILYVSKNLSFLDLQKLKGIESHQVKTEEEFIFRENIPLSGWYSREFSNGDKVLVKTDLEKLRSEFLKDYDHKKTALTRENGNALNAIEFNNFPKAKVFMKIRVGEMTVRTFREEKTDKSYRISGMGGREGNGPEEVVCTQYTRTINQEFHAQAGLDSFLENLSVPVIHDASVTEQTDEKGIFWHMKLAPEQEKLVLSLLSKDPATYRVTGLYRVSCLGNYRGKFPLSTVHTNDEGKLSYEVETFVEKLQ